MRTLEQVNRDILNTDTNITLLNQRKTTLCSESDEIQTELDRTYTESEEGKLADGMVKLYDVPRYSWVSIDHDPKNLFFFDHIDRMDSYCLTLKGDVMHIQCSTLVYVHDLPKLYRPDFFKDDAEEDL